MSKQKAEISAVAATKAIQDGNLTSLTQVSKALGLGKGSVSGSVAKRLREILPNIDGMLAQNKDAGKKPAIKEGKWPRDKRNVFRAGTSSYGIAFDILAAHKAGLPKGKLVELLAEATGKDAKHAGYDAQVLLSAKPNEDGLSNNDSPRHRSCRHGFWVQRTNGHVKLMFD